MTVFLQNFRVEDSYERIVSQKPSFRKQGLGNITSEPVFVFIVQSCHLQKMLCNRPWWPYSDEGVSKIKKMYVVFFICVMMFLVSCGGKSDSILSYSADDICLKCINYGNIVAGFPRELLILESGEQLEYALNNYEYLDVFSLELSTITTEYPIREYVYIIQYFERSYGSEFVCNKLYIDKNEMTIHFEYKVKPLRRDGPAAESASIVYAVLPKEYLNGYDFSNQQGVLYLGK